MAQVTRPSRKEEYEKCCYTDCEEKAIHKHWVKPLYFCVEHYKLFLFIIKIGEDRQ